MKKKILEYIEEVTKGKSYKANKYSLDSAERPEMDYDKKKPENFKHGETEKKNKDVNLRAKANEQREQEPIFTFFLDGSRRVFKVDDHAFTIDGGKSFKIYPIVAGQIGVGCCKRTEKKLSIEKFIREIVISIPDIAKKNRGEGFFESLSNKVSINTEILLTRNIIINEIFPYKTNIDDQKFIDKGIAKIQDRMIALEKDLVNILANENKLNQDNYLIKDGSLEYQPSEELKRDRNKYKTFKGNYQHVIGLSKSFNTELCKDSKGKINPGQIADLRLFHRTPVIKYEFTEDSRLGSIHFAIWYIRLREHKRTRSPFDGILKVEKILLGKDELVETELVDVLSAHIINERVPSCYGSDSRWANHIYPVYLTESYVKSQYISEQSFLNLF